MADDQIDPLFEVGFSAARSSFVHGRPVRMAQRLQAPNDPPVGQSVMWMDSTGDIYIKANIGGTVKTGLLSDYESSATTGTWRVIAASAVAASITGTTSETTLATITIPAGAMGANGFIRVSSVWSYTNSANNKTLRVRFGGTAGPSNTLTTTVSAPIICTIGNRNSVSSQVMGPATGGTAATTAANQTAAIDTSASTTLTLTATLANTGETITLESYVVELLNQA